MTESATLDFPPIVEPAQAQAPAPTALSLPPLPGAALVVIETGVPEYRSTAQMLAELEQRLKGIAYPALETGAGMQVALDDRRALRDLRIGLNKLCEAKNKEQRAATKRDCEARDAGAEKLTKAIEALEKPIDEQIKAEEARKEAARLERQRIEAERVAKHRANIERIRGYVSQAQGQPSDKIAGAIAFVCGLTFGPEYEEFAGEAASSRDEVVVALNSLYATTKAREEEAARLEAQRIEQARIAAEQAEVQRRLDEQAAELKRRQDEIDRAEREAQAKRDAEAARIAARPTSVSVPPVDDNAGSGSPAVESEKQADSTEALPIAAARAMDLPEVIEPAPVAPLVIAGKVFAVGELSDADAPLTIGIPAIQLKLACGRVVTITGLSRDECAAAGPMFMSSVRLIVEAA